MKNFTRFFFNTIDDAVNTCGDKAALSVLQLGINYQLAITDLNNIHELANLFIRGTLALDILHNIAREKIKSLTLIDQIEVYLGYPTSLKSN